MLFGVVWCVVLCCVVLCCAALCYVVLCCVVLHRFVSCCVVSWHSDRCAGWLRGFPVVRPGLRYPYISLTAAGSPTVSPAKKRALRSQAHHLAHAKLFCFRSHPVLSASALFPCFDQIISNYLKYRQYREQTEKLAAQLQGVDGNKQA